MRAFVDALRIRLAAPLPGLDAQLTMAPRPRPGWDPTVVPPGLRDAAGLLLVYPHEGRWHVPLTERGATLRHHTGQVSLPGGRVDPGESAQGAALRELAEEVGLDLPDSAVLGLLDDYPTRSGYVITPVVVWGGDEPELRADPREVAEVHRIPLAALLRPEVPRLRRIPESDRPVLSIPLPVADVHAPTAAIVYQLREVVIRGEPTRVAHFEQPVFAWR